MINGQSQNGLTQVFGGFVAYGIVCLDSIADRILFIEKLSSRSQKAQLSSPTRLFIFYLGVWPFSLGYVYLFGFPTLRFTLVSSPRKKELPR